MFNPFNAVKPTLYDPFSCPMAYPQGYEDAPSSTTDDARLIDLLQHKGEHPGEANVKDMLVEATRQKIPFSEDALRIVSDNDYSEARLNRLDLHTTEVENISKGSWKTITNKIFFVAIGLLTTWALMEACGKGEIATFGKYFQVPKGEHFWRVIVDARTAGRLCFHPPPVNFPHLRTLLTEVASLIFLGSMWAVTGDWKYWFYQIPINDSLKRRFGIQVSDPDDPTKTIFRRMRCLPMGWPWSPRIAQCIGWLVILHREKDAENLGVHESWGDNPPSFVRLRDGPNGKTTGLIFLWLDNVMVLSLDESLRNKWYNRLDANARRFNVRWKNLEKTSKPKYLGIFFRWIKNKVVWCHESERTKKWRLVVNQDILTARDVARHVGIAIWHQMVTLEPLYEISDSIEIMRRISPRLKSKKDWDKPLAELSLTLPLKDIRTLREHVRTALRNKDVMMDTTVAMETAYVCMDACKEDQSIFKSTDPKKRLGAVDNGAGVVWFGKDHTEYQAERHRWSDAERLLPIHVLEIKAVKWALIDILPPARVRTRLVIGEDNTIVVAALSKGYSSCAATRIEIKEIFALCKAKNYVLEIIWVPSLENAADPLSRGFDACPERNKMTWDILHGGTPRTARKGRPLTLEDDEDLPDDYEGDLIKECLEEAGDEELNEY